MDKYPTMWRNLSNFSLNFENSVELLLKCQICKDVIVNAKQSECGCRFCEKCLEDYIDSGNEICPGDREECQHQNIVTYQCVTDHVANRQISELIVNCPFDQCCYKCSVKDLDNHMNICEFNLPATIELDEIEERTVRCDYCDLILDINEMKSIHHNIENEEFCEQFEGKCPYECDSDELFPLKQHLTVCVMKPIACPFFPRGCIESSICQMRIKDHLHENALQHTNLLLEIVSNLENEIHNSENQLIFKENQINEFREKLNRIEADNRDVTRENERLKYEMDNVKLELAAINRSIGELRNPRPEAVESLSSCELNNLKYSIETHETELSVMRRLLGENDLKYESRYMEYIWRIDNLSQLQEDARLCNDKRLVYSKHFFTSHYGYRLRMAMVPFSHNSGFVSLKFQFLKSRFDEILEWPFKFDISIAILNQTDSSNPVELHSFYDPTNDEQMRIYQRPQGEFSGLFGFPEFIKRRALNERPGLLVDDTMFVKFTAKPINLG